MSTEANVLIKLGSLVLGKISPAEITQLADEKPQDEVVHFYQHCLFRRPDKPGNCNWCGTPDGVQSSDWGEVNCIHCISLNKLHATEKELSPPEFVDSYILIRHGEKAKLFSGWLEVQRYILGIKFHCSEYILIKAPCLAVPPAG